jgi:hypothetical protein
LILPYVAEVVEDQEMVFVELVDRALQRQRLTGLLQTLHEIDRSGKQHAVSALNEGMTQSSTEMRLPRSARAEQQDRAASVDPSVAAGERRDVRATDHGHDGEVETVQRLAGWQMRLDQMSLDATLDTFCEFQLGEGCQQSCRRPALAVGALGEGLPHGGDGRQPQLTEEQRQPCGVDRDRVAGAVVHAAAPIDGRSAS